MYLVSLATVCALGVGATAQSCPRPVPPAGGFATSFELAVPVTYSDAYQTFASLQLPDVAAPSCGWPLVVHVHQLGGSRFDDLPIQTLLAQQGYAVWSYDVRAQGEAFSANIGHPHEGTTLMGPVERHDLAEQVAFVAADPAWQGIVDTSRLAVVGKSQGGAHAWLAAALSGEMLMTPDRTPIVFPMVQCVAAFDFVGDTIDDWLRDGQLFSSWLLEAISGSYQGLPFDQALVQACRAGFIAQDPAGLFATLTAEGRAIGPMLATSSVPVLYGHAWFDAIDSPLSGLRRLESLQGPRRALLSTIGHGVPANDLEQEMRVQTTLRWLHRFLWQEQNEVETEIPHLLSLVPLDAAQRDDPLYRWSKVQVADLGVPASPERLYLHDDLVLRDVAPSTVQVPLAVEQVIDPQAATFNPIDYLDQPAIRDLANVLTVCPLDEQVWSITLPADREIISSPLVHLNVVPDAAAWMLAALLTVEPVGGEEVMLTSRAIASRESVPGVAEQFDLRLPPIACQLPADAVLRLRLRNLWLRESPMAQGLEVAPLFTDFRVEVVPGAEPDGSWLDLPLAPIRPRLVTDRIAIDLDVLQPVTGTIRGGAVRDGLPFFAMVGFSGQVPATPYLNEIIPIDGDWLVVASAGSGGSAFYQGFLGFLDSAGEATITLDYSSVAPLPQVLNGLQLTMTAFVWDAPWAPTGATTNSCDILLR